MPASSGGEFELDWYTIDGGGGTSQGDNYRVSGTIGQPEVSPLMAGGGFTVVGGFWGEAKAISISAPVYLPLVLTNK